MGEDLISAPLLSELIGSIYDCALEPEHWSATLTALRDTLGFHNAALTLVGLPSSDVLLTVTSGIEQPWLERIPLYGPDIVEQWGGREVVDAIPLEEPAVLSRVNAAAYSIEAGNRFHLEWEKPQGLHDNMAIGLARDATAIGSVGFGRHERNGAIGEREIAMARLFIPHLQRAAAISRLLEIKTVAATTFETVIDTLTASVVLVDAHLRLIHANQAARAMLLLGDPLGIKSDRVSCRSAGATAALAAAIAQVAERESGLARKGMGIPVRTTNGQACALHVLPLRYGKLRASVAPRAIAAIFVAPAGTLPPSPKALVAKLFDLTAAEACVFEHIASGLTPAQTAQALGVGLSTVKTHLIRLFDKTGVHRQIDLVRLAASFALPIAR